MILDAMTMIKMLEKDPLTKRQIEFQKKKGIAEEFVPSMEIPDEKETISPSIRFDENRLEGRFARAATDIKVGEEILIEKPFVAVLLEKFSKSHCDNCFIRLAFHTKKVLNFFSNLIFFSGLELLYQWHVPHVWMLFTVRKSVKNVLMPPITNMNVVCCLLYGVQELPLTVTWLCAFLPVKRWRRF